VLRRWFQIFRLWVVVSLVPSMTLAQSQAAGDRFADPAAMGRIRIPVQVVTENGAESKWVLVEVAGESVPEPRTLILALMGSLFLLRRKRK